MNAMMMMMTI